MKNNYRSPYDNRNRVETPIDKVIPGSSVYYRGKTWTASTRRKNGSLIAINRLLLSRLCESTLISDPYVTVLADENNRAIVDNPYRYEHERAQS